MAYLFYDNATYKVLGFTDNQEYVVPDSSTMIEITNDEWMQLIPKTDDIYLDKDTPEDLTKVTYKTPIVEIPAEIKKAIEEGQKIQDLNNAIEALARVQAKIISPSLNNSELLEIKALFDDWEVGKDYSKGDLINAENVLYRVLQAHTSQEDWKPADIPSLYTKITPEGTILEFGKNPDGTSRDLTNNPYTIGEKCLFNGKTYESLIDNNIWSPDGYPAGWKEV